MYPSDFSDVDHPSVPDTCAECGCELYPDEADLCRRCAEARIAAEAEAHARGEDAA